MNVLISVLALGLSVVSLLCLHLHRRLIRLEDVLLAAAEGLDEPNYE